MLHRLLPAAGAVAIALLLSGCTSSSTTPPTSPSTTLTTPAASPSAVTPSAVPSATATASTATPSPSVSVSVSVSVSEAESQYLTFVKQFSPTLAAKSDGDLLALGRQVCAGFRRGQDESQVARTLEADARADGLDATGAAAILGGSVGALCPQYRDALQGNG